MKIYHLLVLYDGVEMFFWTNKTMDEWIESVKHRFPSIEMGCVYVSCVEEKEAIYRNVCSRFGGAIEGGYKDFSILVESFGLVKSMLKHDSEGNLIYRNEIIATIIL